MGLKISVVMITYKHQEFIEEAILSVLNQIVDFGVELIIADDNSPDNTNEIVDKIIKTHQNGNWIKYTKHEKNIGMQKNFVWALKQAKGEFIALCEGDDYWTSSNKLKEQYHFMKNNSLDMSFHHGFFVNNESVNTNEYIIKPKSWNFISFLEGQMPFTSSLMFNRFKFDNLNPYNLLLEYTSCDKVLLSVMSLNQKVGLLNINGSVYRQHELGVSKYFNKLHWGLNEIKMHNALNYFSNKFYNNQLRLINSNVYFNLAENYSTHFVMKIKFILLGIIEVIFSGISFEKIKRVIFCTRCILSNHRYIK